MEYDEDQEEKSRPTKQCRVRIQQTIEGCHITLTIEGESLPAIQKALEFIEQIKY